MKIIFMRCFRFVLIFVLHFSSFSVFGQYAEGIIKKLASSSFHGRGYYKNGDGIAAQFISSEFKAIGLQPIKDSYFQPFTFPVNTFPGKMEVKINNKKLVAGQDYIVSPACPSVKGEFKVVKVTIPIQKFNMFEDGNTFIIIDKSGL